MKTGFTSDLHFGHANWRVRGRMINVGVDAWNQAPVSEAQLAAVIANGPADIGAFDAVTV